MKENDYAGPISEGATRDVLPGVYEDKSTGRSFNAAIGKCPKCGGRFLGMTNTGFVHPQDFNSGQPRICLK